jgi:hypothetical protein
MKTSLIFLMAGVSIGVVLAVASPARADCGDGVTTAGEACDNGTATCAAGSKESGSECHQASDCTGGPANVDNCVCDLATFPRGCNRDDLPNACRSTCMLPMCGDGVSDASEQCDEGANNSLNGPCKPPYSACVGGLRDGLPCTTNGDCSAPAPLPNGLCKTNDGCLLNVCGDGLLCSEAGCPMVRVDLLTQQFAPEQCDDGNTNDMDSCLSNGATATIGGQVFTVSCANNICGDGVSNMGVEQCDLGVSICLDGPKTGKPCCTNSDCMVGNVMGTLNCSGVLNGDDNNNTPNSNCRCNCKLPFCGDGISDNLQNEECDDGTTANTPGQFCNKERRCIGGENGCTDANGNGQCDSNVTENASRLAAPLCGDNPSLCVKGTCGKTACVENSCGDGIIGGNEMCDDGNTVDANTTTDTCGVNTTTWIALSQETGCSTTLAENLPGACPPQNCMLPLCGDGVTQGGEMCDGGVATCSAPAFNAGAKCTRASQCKNPPGNVSDLCSTISSLSGGNANRDDLPNFCRSNCMPPGCGDGVVDAGEQCDAGAANGPTKPCTSVCTFAACGDGQVCSDPACTSGPNGGPEQCDDGNAVDPTATNGDVCGGSLVGNPDIVPCAAATCGDGVTNPGEQCDSMSMGCSNMREDLGPLEQAFDCCFDGNIVDGDKAGLAPGLLSVEQGLTAVTGCRLLNLIGSAACDQVLQNALLKVLSAVQAGEVYFENDDITRARRLLRTAEKRLNRLNRRVARATRLGGPCAANRQAITNQKANAAYLVAGVIAHLTEDSSPFGP